MRRQRSVTAPKHLSSFTPLIRNPPRSFLAIRWALSTRLGTSGAADVAAAELAPADVSAENRSARDTWQPPSRPRTEKGGESSSPQAYASASPQVNRVASFCNKRQ